MPRLQLAEVGERWCGRLLSYSGCHNRASIRGFRPSPRVVYPFFHIDRRHLIAFPFGWFEVPSIRPLAIVVAPISLDQFRLASTFPCSWPKCVTRPSHRWRSRLRWIWKPASESVVGVGDLCGCRVRPATVTVPVTSFGYGAARNSCAQRVRLRLRRITSTMCQ